jgi:hypothetical protein
MAGHQLDRFMEWSFFFITGEYYKYILLYLFAVFIIIFTKSIIGVWKLIVSMKIDNMSCCLLHALLLQNI